LKSIVSGSTAAAATEAATGKRAGKIRIGVMLPMRSSALGAAANAVYSGIQAGQEREPDGVLINVIETDGTAQDAVSGYAKAVAQNDIIIGPLSRTELSAITLGEKILKPTIALAPADVANDADSTLSPKILAIGLSIEQEARQLAIGVSSYKTSNKAFVISTSTAWQRRAANAFAAQWRKLGLEAELIDLQINDGYVSANSLVQLKKRLHTENPGLMFVALDAGQTAQLRLGVGTEVAVYGTSQLNHRPPGQGQMFERRSELDGTRLLDIPWQLQPDDPAVMTYPRLVVGVDEQYSPDLSRLYALGIDAYRVAREVASNNHDFDLDGVTGKLAVNFGDGPAKFERTEQPAIYRDGLVVPVLGITP
jgi:outer membrane PBP1 activator LpoA protein